MITEILRALLALAGAVAWSAVLILLAPGR